MTIYNAQQYLEKLIEDAAQEPTDDEKRIEAQNASYFLRNKLFITGEYEEAPIELQG